MTKNRKAKNAARDRSKRTGESFGAARAAEAREYRKAAAFTLDAIADAMDQRQDTKVTVKLDGATGTLTLTTRVHGERTTLMTADGEQASRLTAELRASISLTTSDTLHTTRQVNVDGVQRTVRVSQLRTADDGFLLIFRMASSDLVTLDRLGLTPDARSAVEALLRQPNGIVLSSGTVGSGRTSTAYALMHADIEAGRTITSLEHPEERNIPGVHYAEMLADAGPDDLIFVDEIRDGSTAHECVAYCESGHRVLTTIHASDNVIALLRFASMLSAQPNRTPVIGVISHRFEPGVNGGSVVTDVLTVTDELRVAIAGGRPLLELRAIAVRNTTV